MAPQLKQFCRSLAAAKLISPAELEKVYRHWRTTDPDNREDIKSFARAVVQRGQVPAEQIAKIIKQLPVTVEPAPIAAGVDVELVIVPDPQRRFSRRDWLVAGIGAAVATAIVVPVMLIVRSGSSQIE